MIYAYIYIVMMMMRRRRRMTMMMMMTMMTMMTMMMMVMMMIMVVVVMMMMTMTMMDQFTWIQPFMFSFCYFSSVRFDLFPLLIIFWVVGHGGPDPRFPFATHCLFSRHRSTSDAGMIYWADDGWNRCNTWLGQPNPSLKISDHRSVRDLMQLESYSRTWNKFMDKEWQFEVVKA